MTKQTTTIRSMISSHLSVFPSRHAFAGASQQQHQFTLKRIITKAVGAVAVISIFTVAAASQQPSATDTQASHKKNTSDVQLQASTSPSQQDQSTGGATMSQSTSQSSTAGGDAANNTTSTVQVTVNGQDVAVPASGTTQQTVASPSGGSTTVSISNDSSSNGTSFTSNVTSQNINSSQSDFGSSSTWQHTSSGP